MREAVFPNMNVKEHSETQVDFDKILILDFGSQYTQLIARRVRECQIYSEIHPYTITVEEVMSFSPKGIILSGGPASVYEKDAPHCDPAILALGIPVLGICYGMQLIGQALGGKGRPFQEKGVREGDVDPLIRRESSSKASAGREVGLEVWMSHGDQIRTLPPGFHAIAHSENTPYTAIEHQQKKIYGLQFHPEVVHTPKGIHLIKNFLFHVCGCTRLWTMKSFLDQTRRGLKKKIGSKRVICALSGGVDSAVVALLLHKVIGDSSQVYLCQQRRAEKERGRPGGGSVSPLFQDTAGLRGRGRPVSQRS